MSLESLQATIATVLAADAKGTAAERFAVFLDALSKLNMLGQTHFHPLIMVEARADLKAKEAAEQLKREAAEAKREALESTVRAKLGIAPDLKVGDKVHITHIGPSDAYVYTAPIVKVDGATITVTVGSDKHEEAFSWCCHQLYVPVGPLKYIHRVEIIRDGEAPAEFKQLPDLTDEEVRAVPGLVEYYTHLKAECKSGLMKVGDGLLIKASARGEHGGFWVMDHPFKVLGTIAGGHFFWYRSYKGYSHGIASEFGRLFYSLCRKPK